jgi:hypothetical protein
MYHGAFSPLVRGFAWSGIPGNVSSSLSAGGGTESGGRAVQGRRVVRRQTQRHRVHRSKCSYNITIFKKKDEFGSERLHPPALELGDFGLLPASAGMRGDS